VIDIAVQAPGDVADRLGAVVRYVCAELGIDRASVGLMVVGPEQMAAINGAHRAKPEPTDVLSFPVDGPDVLEGWPEDGPEPELGDIVICPEAASDPLETLTVHGMLHLVGYDHEVDAGEMLALQDDLVDRYPGSVGS
jgi:probable rRNA maturation factor